MKRTTLCFAALTCAVLFLNGCSLAKKAAINLVYDPTNAPAEVLTDIAYYDGEGFDAQKHRLDLFIPAGNDWPALIFVHGGSFEKGDKDFQFGGADLYSNVGRFYADHGFGVAVISYRLQPQVTWHDQVMDVARATAWVKEHAAEHGGNGTLVLSGHSAGAYLASRVALDAEIRREVGLADDAIAGVAAISGAGYDLTDDGFWNAGADQTWWAGRFDTGAANWKQDASVAPLITAGAPPFFLLYGTDEWPSLAYDNVQLDLDFQAAGVPVTLVRAKGLKHAFTVIQMSQRDAQVSAAVLAFLGPLTGAPIASSSTGEAVLTP